MQLYMGQSIKEEMSLAEARWVLYTKLQDSNKLPPTADALKFKILRSHLTCLVWKSSHLRSTILSDRVYYGWEKDGGVYIPVMTDQLPAPIAVIEMSVNVIQDVQTKDANVERTNLFVLCARVANVKM